MTKHLARFGLLCTALTATGCPVRMNAPEDAGATLDVPVTFPDAPFLIPDAGLCEPGTVRCGSTCTRVVADSNNCGSCGNVCPAGTSCALGECGCIAPMLGCGGLCTDPMTDPENCGECGKVCAAAETCTAGACICTDPDLARCFDDTLDREVCVDLENDPLNCGTCGNVCGGEATSCMNGVCTCPSGLPACDGVCLDLLNDDSNCGTCGTTCLAPTACASGVCTCPGGGAICAEGCTDLATDPLNCGACLTSCGADGTCTAGACTTCGTGLTRCGTGRCVNTMTSRLHCGMCGRACGPGEACVDGLCECTGTLVDCGSGCTDLGSDESHCGVCGVDCGPGGVCSGGTCTCATGLTMCGPECADLSRNREHCGSCPVACAMGQICRMGSCVDVSSFRVTSFDATGCAVMEHGSPSGDDHGGVALSMSQFFVTGDSATVRLSATDLSGVASTGAVHNGIFTDLATETPYVLMTGTTELGSSVSTGTMITGLGELDGATGVLGPTRITLSSAVPIAYGTAVMSGYGFLLLGVPATGRLDWTRIEIPSGTVVPLGATQNPTHWSCESWGWWGVGEYFGDVYYATYVESGTRIARLAIPATGMSTTAPATAGTFTRLGDMCSITFSPSRNRWYFHHEYDSQFSPTTLGGEIGGYCNGTWDSP